MAENKNGLVVDPNDPNYKIKPGDSTEAVQQTNQSELVVDPNDPNYQVKPANMVAEPTTPSTTDTGQTTPNSNEEPKQETTPVANNGEQQATQTTGTQNDVTTPKANTPQVNPADYTFTESELQAMEQQQTPQGGVVGDGGSTGLYNWDNPGTTIDKVLADPGNENKKSAILNDYLKWAYRNNQPIDYFAINEAIHNKDISKSPADDAKEQKRKERKEKWDKVGNFLLHLGNVVGNVAGGGMGSVKLEDPVQWSERQRMLKERTEQLQNSYNQSILAQMTKQNADMRNAEMAKAKEQRDQQKLENDKRRLDQSDARIFLATEQFKWKQQMDQKNFDLKKAREEVWKAVQEGRLNNESARIVLGQLNYDLKKWQAENPVQSTTTVQTPLGTKTTKKVQSRGNGNQVNSNLIPPSKQKQNQGNNNTPPSRR